MRRFQAYVIIVICCFCLLVSCSKKQQTPNANQLFQQGIENNDITKMEQGLSVLRNEVKQDSLNATKYLSLANAEFLLCDLVTVENTLQKGLRLDPDYMTRGLILLLLSDVSLLQNTSDYKEYLNKALIEVNKEQDVRIKNTYLPRIWILLDEKEKAVKYMDDVVKSTQDNHVYGPYWLNLQNLDKDKYIQKKRFKTQMDEYAGFSNIKLRD
jgi:tetratricopeptide (TPR) repeat protein